MGQPIKIEDFRRRRLLMAIQAVEPRYDEIPEKLDQMIAHEGVCRHCGNIVKMARSEGALEPNRCWCLACGQIYFMEIQDIEAWEMEQWEQKFEKITGIKRPTPKEPMKLYQLPAELMKKIYRYVQRTISRTKKLFRKTK